MRYLKYSILFVIISFAAIGCGKKLYNPESAGAYLDNDYFPLKTGNKWVFNYDLVNRDDSNYYEAKGTLSWEIINKKSDSEYEFSSVLNSVRSYYQSGADTAALQHDSLTFIVSQASDGTVSFIDPHLLVDNIKFSRFHLPFNDSGKIDVTTSQFEDAVTLTLNKNIGIAQFTMNHSHNTAPTGTVILENHTVIGN